jgi:uncharacterized damage-inducible protein DinB
MAVEIRTIQPFLQYFGNVRERTMRVARCVPAGKVEWSYVRGKFSIGDLLRHIAVTERYMFAENIQGKPSRYTAHGKDLADGLENILTFMERLHGESMEIFGKLTDGDLENKCASVAGTQVARWKLLRSMVEHEVHHRGQIYIYLGLLGAATPPLYGMTSEQVRERRQF